MIKSLWKDPVWSAVIAAGIVATLGAIGTYFFGYWPAIWSAIQSAWHFFAAASYVPNWLLAIIIILALPTLLLVALAVKTSVFKSWPEQPNWTAYVSDTFFGLRWRWEYFSDNIQGLNSFCPHCDYQVFPHEFSDFGYKDSVSFTCDSCHQKLGSFNQTHLQMTSKIERFIQQKIRNSTWHHQP